MHSKWSPWEYIQKSPEVIEKGSLGLYAFSFPDAVIERIFIDRLKKSNNLGEVDGDTCFILGSDLTIDWILNNLQTLGLFGNNNPYVVLNAESISASVIDYIIEQELVLDDRFLALFYSKESGSFDKLKKKFKEATFTSITAPKFWEGQKLLNFISSELNYLLNFDIQNYIVNSLENNSLDFFQAVNMIQTYYPEPNDASLILVKKIIQNSKFDQFELASKYSKKNFNLFFKSLLSHSDDFDSLRSLFNFLQGHLIKILDSSYVEKKPKPSKYDNEIVANSKLWKKSELDSAIKLFSNLEIEAKKRNPGLVNLLRSEYLGSLN